MLKRLAPLTALVLLSLPAVARANDWVRTDRVLDASSTPESAASAYVDLERVPLGLGGVDLAFRNSARVRASSGAVVEVVHFEQRWHGLRVVGRGVAVQQLGARTLGLSKHVADDLTVSPVPDVTLDDAILAASVALGAPLDASGSELAVLGDEGGRLVWIVDGRNELGVRYYVDAHTGEVVMGGSRALDAKGRVYKISSVTTPTPSDEDLLTLDEAAIPVRLNGWSGLLTVTNYVSGGQMGTYVVEQTLGPSSGTDFLYDPPAMATDKTDAFAQVNLFYHLTSMRDYFTGLGVDSTAAKWKLTAVANMGENGAPLDNAFYSPQGIQGAFPAPNLIGIGQGTSVDFAYDSDVFKHEFGHYVTGNTVN